MTYSTTTDLLVGDVITDETLKQKHVDQAANEIDSQLGFMYDTPLDQAVLSRPAWLLIQKISNHLASGRLMMEINQAGEENKVYDYGKYLIEDAQAAIASILEGDINLIPPVDGSTGGPEVHPGVRVMNTDPYSMVEAFYGWAARPNVPVPHSPFLPGVPLYPG